MNITVMSSDKIPKKNIYRGQTSIRRAPRYRAPRASVPRENGAVLVLSLLILMVLTMLAVMAMDGSRFAYKMSVNRIFYDEAFNHSESARKASAQSVRQIVLKGEIQPELMSSGLSAEFNEERVTDKLVYRNGQIYADIYISKGVTIANRSGAAIAQFQGYSGTGQGLGAKGSVIKMVEVRSAGRVMGRGLDNLRVWTASDYRIVP